MCVVWLIWCWFCFLIFVKIFVCFCYFWIIWLSLIVCDLMIKIMIVRRMRFDEMVVSDGLGCFFRYCSILIGSVLLWVLVKKMEMG